MLLIWLLAACEPLPASVAPDEVIALEVCPEGDLCELNADGLSVISVQACVATDTSARVDPLDLTLTLSSGGWVDSGGSDTLLVDVSTDPCAQALFTPGTDDPLVVVEAEVAGLRMEERVWLNPASFGALQLSPSSAELNGEPFQQMTLTLEVFGPSGGEISEGSVFEVEVLDVSPSGANAALWPGEGFVVDGGAQVDLTLSGAPSELRLLATVEPPDWASAPSPPPGASVELLLLGGG